MARPPSSSFSLLLLHYLLSVCARSSSIVVPAAAHLGEQHGASDGTGSAFLKMQGSRLAFTILSRINRAQNLGNLNVPISDQQEERDRLQ
jgi:hypothetical protein